MLKKKIISLLVALTLVLTTVIPSVTFASGNEEAQTEVQEEVSGGDEALEEVKEEKKTIHCAECDSENVNFLLPVLNLYHCEDCGKYFTVGVGKNKKSVSEQISAVEDDAKKEVEEALYGVNNSVVVTYIIFQDGKNRGTQSHTYEDRDLAKYFDVDDEKVFCDVNTKFPGWIFKGYATAAGGEVVYMPGDKVVAKRLFTVYEKEEYKVNVYKNCGADDKDELLDSAKFNYGDTYTYDKVPTREGYRFLGWSEDKNAVESDIDSINIDSVTKSMNFYAIWIQELGVKYPGLDIEIYEKGTNVVLKDTFKEKTGYTLEGWSEVEDSTEVTYELGSTIENIDRGYTLYPVYIPIDCDIVIDGETFTVKYDSEYTLPETYEDKEGYAFIGFKTESKNYKTSFTKGETFIVKGDAEFTPVYGINSYEIKVGDLEPEIVEFGSEYVLPEKYDLGDDTKVLEGYKDQDGNVYNPGDKFSVPNKDMKFEVLTRDKEVYVVSFLDVTGDTITEIKVLDGDVVERPKDPEKDYYNFVAWVTEKNSTDEFDFATTIVENTTLYASWDAKSYTIVVDGDVDEKKYGTTFDLPKTAKDVPEDKKLVGWKNKETDKHYDIGEAVTVVGEATYVPEFSNKDTFTVYFMDDRTELSKVENVGEFETVTRPSTPTKDNYDFVNWYADRELTELFDFDSVILDDTYVYSKWDPKTYTITVDGVEYSAKYGSTYTLPSTVNDKDGNECEGFKKDGDTKLYALGDSFIVDGPATFVSSFVEVGGIYVKEFYLSSNNNDSSALTELTSAGFEVFNQNLNFGTGGGNYVYLGYKSTSDPNEAITDLRCWIGNSRIEDKNKSYEGHNYKVVGETYDNKCDLNRAGGGAYMVLYQTSDDGAGKPIKVSDVKMYNVDKDVAENPDTVLKNAQIKNNKISHDKNDFVRTVGTYKSGLITKCSGSSVCYTTLGAGGNDGCVIQLRPTKDVIKRRYIRVKGTNTSQVWINNKIRTNYDTVRDENIDVTILQGFIGQARNAVIRRDDTGEVLKSTDNIKKLVGTWDTSFKMPDSDVTIEVNNIKETHYIKVIGNNTQQVYVQGLTKSSTAVVVGKRVDIGVLQGAVNVKRTIKITGADGKSYGSDDNIKKLIGAYTTHFDMPDCDITVEVNDKYDSYHVYVQGDNTSQVYVQGLVKSSTIVQEGNRVDVGVLQGAIKCARTCEIVDANGNRIGGDSDIKRLIGAYTTHFDMPSCDVYVKVNNKHAKVNIKVIGNNTSQVYVNGLTKSNTTVYGGSRVDIGVLQGAINLVRTIKIYDADGVSYGSEDNIGKLVGSYTTHFDMPECDITVEVNNKYETHYVKVVGNNSSQVYVNGIDRDSFGARYGDRIDIGVLQGAINNSRSCVIKRGDNGAVIASKDKIDKLIGSFTTHFDMPDCEVIVEVNNRNDRHNVYVRGNNTSRLICAYSSQTEGGPVTYSITSGFVNKNRRLVVRTASGREIHSCDLKKLVGCCTKTFSMPDEDVYIEVNNK